MISRISRFKNSLKPHAVNSTTLLIPCQVARYKDMMYNIKVKYAIRPYGKYDR
jgi:hypothetical protein